MNLSFVLCSLFSTLSLSPFFVRITFFCCRSYVSVSTSVINLYGKLSLMHERFECIGALCTRTAVLLLVGICVRRFGYYTYLVLIYFWTKSLEISSRYNTQNWFNGLLCFFYSLALLARYSFNRIFHLILFLLQFFCRFSSLLFSSLVVVIYCLVCCSLCVLVLFWEFLSLFSSVFVVRDY